jgi:adenylate cyclase
MAGSGTGEAPGGRRLRLSLKLKLSLLITSLLVLTVAILGGILAHQEQQSLTTEMTKRGLTIASNLANSAKNPILTNDDLTLSLLVQDTMKDPDVAYVVFADAEGKVVAHPDLSLIGKPVTVAELASAGDELRVSSSLDPRHGKLINFALPLVFSKVRVGSLYMGFSERTIQAALGRARLKTLAISAVMVLAGLGGAVALASLIARPVHRLVAGTRAIAAGDFTISIPVTSGDEVGLLTDSFNQMARNLREKEMIKRAFTRYVAREVVDEILKDPERLVLKEERRDVSVLFCDMRGFTTISERLTPEEVVGILNEFYTLMIDTTFKQDGTLDKFLGDGVMSIFGAPILHPDHSIRAIRTALAMQAGVAELSRRRVSEGKEPVAVGIGISAGEAVAGTVGTEDRMEYTVIGDSVNLAARLESNAKGGQILISERTYKNVEGQVQVRSLGVLKIKGKEEQVQVYEVLSLAQEA